ncbi:MULTISPECIES: type II secretion system minor pseudopilin GspK [unclassified Psychrobacter]|uniref:type II secretion system minor pseudopilin GspK n=2 Tax=Psychrobacter TaxID=497 RepID=UPI003FD12616
MSITANSQRGVALLTVLLLVVSITVVAGAMLASQKIVIRRSGLLLNQDQLLQDIHAGEQLAVTMIRADNELNNTDSTQDIWAQPIPPYALGAHSISIELRDEASRFNINNLYQNGTVNSAALAILQKLLTQLSLEPDIATAILDWQDTDSEVYKDGGDEGAVYDSGSPAHTLPNQPFISVDQLLDVSGVDDKALAALRPYITAVPYDLPINVNTASPVLLASLVEGATTEQMQTLTDLRTQQVMGSIDELWQLPALVSVTDEQRQALTPLLSVDSRAFSGLVTASDSDGKQRFAIILIKNALDEGNTTNNESGAASSNLNNQNTSGNNVNSGANDVNGSANNAAASSSESSADKTVKVINRRLYAFRPSF